MSAGPSLRSFLDQVQTRRPSDLVRVDREVDPHHETAAIVVKLESRGRSPLLVFERVKGTDLTVVTNVCGSMGRVALALECPVGHVAAEFGRRSQQHIPPRPFDGEAPCQEVVLAGDAVDLDRLPRLVYHLDDADEPYITGGIVVARDPQTGTSNLSFHRLMISGRATTGILMEPGRHLDQIFRKHVAQGTDMPIAVFVGSHPLWSLGALHSGPAEVEEYDVIGGLLQAPLSVAPCVTRPDLVVPAETELVLEGMVSCRDRMREGPFGEFTGYGTGITQTPVFRVEAMTHRRDFVFQDIVSGHMEHLTLSMPAIEHRTLEAARSAVEGEVRVALVAPLTSVIAIAKSDDHEPRRLIETVLRSDTYAKHVIVVDADVEPSDLRAVLSAVALHSQADRDVVILPDERGTPLDPSCTREDGRSAKMGIDATRALAGRDGLTRNRLPQDLLDRIDVKALLRRRG